MTELNAPHEKRIRVGQPLKTCNRAMMQDQFTMLVWRGVIALGATHPESDRYQPYFRFDLGSTVNGQELTGYVP